MRIGETTAKQSEMRFALASQNYETTEGLVILVNDPSQITNQTVGVAIQAPWDKEAAEVTSACLELGTNAMYTKGWSQQLIHGVISSSCATAYVVVAVNPASWAESATVKKEQEKEFESEVLDLFEAAKGEIFEDGIESRFSKELNRVIKTFGNDAVKLITNLIVSEYANPEVASEALRWIGRMNHPESYSNRLWLLESCLNSSSSRIRDGAILGLASMDDPNAIPYIKNAMKREYIIELKHDMKQVIDQLENTIGGLHITAGKEK
jgi:hypothetical protein